MKNFILPLAPVPASRPRVTRFGTFYGKRYKQWMADAAALLPTPNEKLSGPLAVELTFVCTRPKTTKRLCPRGDADNFAKAVLDAMTKAEFWEDDDQVVYLIASKRFQRPGEDAHIAISIQEAEA